MNERSLQGGCPNCHRDHDLDNCPYLSTRCLNTDASVVGHICDARQYSRPKFDRAYIINYESITEDQQDATRIISYLDAPARQAIRAYQARAPLNKVSATEHGVQVGEAKREIDNDNRIVMSARCAALNGKLYCQNPSM